MARMSHRAARLAVATALLAAPAAAQETPPAPDRAGASAEAAEIAALREEVASLRAQIEALRELIRSLTAARGEGAGAPAAAPAPESPPAAPEPPQEAPPSSAPAVARHPQIPSLLNPALSAVFQTIGNTSLGNAREENGFDLSEAEIAFQSVVDPYAKVDLFLSFPAGETPEVEEGFLTTLSLPGSLQLKAGRMKSAFGKWNTLHAHAFFTVDRPGAFANFFGEESLTSDGLSLSFLVPNPWGLYLDSITEVGTALEGSAFNSAARNLTWLQHMTAFFNVSPNATFEAGVTAARGRTGPSEPLLEAIDATGLTGVLAPREELDSAAQGLDLTYKWKPLQLNVYRSFLWQTEVIRGHRNVDVLAPSGGPPFFRLRRSAVTSLGGYSYVETQFTKRWKEGLRVDQSGFPDDSRAREWGGSAVVRFSPSEFQEIRFQVGRVRRNDAAALRFGGERDDTVVFLEWIPVIGAHGAHKY